MPNLSFNNHCRLIHSLFDSCNDNWRSYQLVQWLPEVLPILHEWGSKIGVRKSQLLSKEG